MHHELQMPLEYVSLLAFGWTTSSQISAIERWVSARTTTTVGYIGYNSRISQIITHIMGIFNAHGKREIQGIKAILFKLKSDTQAGPTIQTDQQGQYLSEGWEFWGFCAGILASTIPERVADLNSKKNKTWFYDKHQYHLRLTLSSTQAESLQDEFTVTPAISPHGELCWIHEPQYSNIPQFIPNHHCRDGVRCNGEPTAWMGYSIKCIRCIIVVTMRGRYPYEVADGQPWECIDSVRGNSFPENIYSPTAPIHSINGKRITHRWSSKRTQALQTTMRSLINISTEHE